MKCPYCFTPDQNRVIEHSKRLKQTTDRGIVVRRKRHCDACGENFWTIEYVREKDKGGN